MVCIFSVSLFAVLQSTNLFYQLFLQARESDELSPLTRGRVGLQRQVAVLPRGFLTFGNDSTDFIRVRMQVSDVFGATENLFFMVRSGLPPELKPEDVSSFLDSGPMDSFRASVQSQDSSSTVNLLSSLSEFLNPLARLNATECPGSAVKDFIECSGRGRCLRPRGVCECDPGFAGPSCETTPEEIKKVQYSLWRVE